MTARFTSSRFPYLPIRVEVRGRMYEVEALLDTGFDGHAALPLYMIPVSEAPNGQVPGVLADGTDVKVNYFLGTVTIGDLGSIAALVLAMGDESLVGRAVSDRFMVILDHGRQLIIEP